MMEESDKKVLFREVQHFRQKSLWIFLSLISLITMYALVQQIILDKPFGSNPASDMLLIIICIIFGFCFPAFFFILNLTIEIYYDAVYFRFFPLQLSFHKIRIQDLQNYEARTYRPIREYGGHGIRYGEREKVYSVSGNKGILLETYRGTRVLIGTR